MSPLAYCPPSPEFRNLIKPTLPALWNAIEPRRYQVPQGFMSPAPFAGMGVASAFAGDGQDESTACSMRARYLTQARLSQFGVPTMLVSRELAHALRRTALPADLSILDLDFPFPAMRFLFEEGSLPFEHGDLGAIEFALYRKGEMIGLSEEAFADKPGQRAAFRLPEQVDESMFSFTSAFRMHGRRHDWEVRTQTSTRYGEDLSNLNWLDQKDANPVLGEAMSYLPPLSTDMPGVGALLLNLILFISAKPEHVEAESVARPPKQKRSRLVEGLYHPQKVGMKFNLVALRSARSASESTGRKLAPGWRCGHWKRVACGVGRVLRRWVHVEPYQYGVSGCEVDEGPVAAAA